MAKVYMLIGPAGVGKSTYAENHMKDCDVSISLDELRKEQDGSYSPAHGKDGLAMLEARRRFADAIKDPSVGDIYLDMANVSRRRRNSWYEDFRSIREEFGYDVEAVFLHKPLEVIVEQDEGRTDDKRVGRSVVERMYKQLTIPRIGVDCDSIVVDAPDISEYEAEMNQRLDEPHNSPYHAETLREHVQMVISGAVATGDPDLIEIATHHDDGKAVARYSNTSTAPASNYVRQRLGDYDNYVGHENVGAAYHLIRHKDELSEHNLLIAEAIQQHMKAHYGISDRDLRINKFSDEELDLFARFAEIDSASRVVDQNLLSMYEKLRNLSNDHLARTACAANDMRVSFNDERELITISYMHSGADFNDPLRRCSALTVDFDGNIVTIGFEKFFNRDQLMFESGADKLYSQDFIRERCEFGGDGPYELREKLDGTFIALGVVGGELVASTKGSTMTEFSSIAEDFFINHPNADAIKQWIVDNNSTLMFEYISPDNFIGVDYDETRFPLIGVRENNINSKCRSYEDMSSIADELGLEVVDRVVLTKDELADHLANDKNFEGYVGINEHGYMVKFKAESWLEYHRGIGKLFFGDPLQKGKFETVANLWKDDNADDVLAFSHSKYGDEFAAYDRICSRLDSFKKDVEDGLRVLEEVGKRSFAESDTDKLVKSAVFFEDRGISWADSRLFSKVVASILDDERGLLDAVEDLSEGAEVVR